MPANVIKRTTALLRLMESALLVAVLAAMMLLAAWQVVARNFFDTGLLCGAMRWCGCWSLWGAMVGAMVASRKDEHIRIDIVSRFASESFKPWLQRFACAFTCVVLGVFAWFSFKFVRFEYQDAVIAFASVPAWVCEAILPVGAGVMSLRYLLHVVEPP